MTTIVATPVRDAAKGDVVGAVFDWGNGAVQPIKGSLAFGETVSTATAVARGPIGCTVPTVGSVTVNSVAATVNNRVCAIGEVTTCLVTFASDQMFGTYFIRVTAVTSLGHTLSRDLQINVEYP